MCSIRRGARAQSWRAGLPDARQRLGCRGRGAAARQPRQTPRRAARWPMAAAIVTLLLNTGLRVDELVTLTWQRVTLQARSGWIDVVGKGDKHRRLPLNVEARKALEVIQ